jgi:DNA uptake protein ComE-like DNA-binding protein
MTRMLNGSLSQRLLIFLLSFVAVARADEQWVTYKGCLYLPNAANDGDSFHVRAAGREYIFRLYFVDAPETDLSIPDRVAEQAKYFHATIQEALQIGIEAQRFTRQKLSRPFTIRTCKQDAQGRSRRPRYFAFVQTDSADDLGEQLIANGLARVYGAATGLPGMRTPEGEWRKLEQLERKAKKQKIGGWGIRAGRLHIRAAAQPSPSTDSFDAFIHPNAAATSERQMPGPGAKLDINSASMEALQNIPGVGNVLAGRIVRARPFKSSNDLRHVKGIGDRNYQKLRPYFE